VALTQKQREDLAAGIAEEGVFETDSLLQLTDNQLVALSDADQLDSLVDLAANAAEKPDMTTMSDEDLMAELAMRKKKSKKAPPTTNSEEEEDDEEAFLAAAPASIRRLVANAQAAEAKQREALVKQITANSSNEFTEDELAEMEVPQLERIAKLARTAPAPNYSGRSGFGATTNSSHVEEPLVAPSLDFSFSDSND
jgi:uncharacterized protein YihD (DUF1040 family)